jgi:hypothetical protein
LEKAHDRVSKEILWKAHEKKRVKIVRLPIFELSRICIREPRLVFTGIGRDFTAL